MASSSPVYVLCAVVVIGSLTHVSSTDLDDVVPFVVPLRRDSLPVKQQGRTVSFKTSYSGLISVGTPAKEVRVVFDTGSGHVVVPDSKCQDDACKIGKATYDLGSSSTGVPINSKGKVVPPTAKKRPNVRIAFGTGGIKGEFVKDIVCSITDEKVGVDAREDENVLTEPQAMQSENQAMQSSPPRRCVEMHVLAAVEMSNNPFYHAKYDGILGLGLDGLTVSQQFSFMHMLTEGKVVEAPRFAVFFSDSDSGEDSEIAFGGYRKERALEPLHWNPVVMQDLGYWQVRILAVRIDGETLDVCKDGTCRGAFDTGSSHLGIPTPFDAEVNERLSRNAGSFLDCRLVPSSTLEIELETVTLSLDARTYMRRLPVRDGIQVGTSRIHDAQSLYSVSLDAGMDYADDADDADGSLLQSDEQFENVEAVEANEPAVKRSCLAKTVGIDLEAPIGPKFFILGEPILRKYYTVYDWSKPAVGVARANSKANTDSAPDPGFRGVLPDDVELLMQLQQEAVEDYRSH